jgi:ElaB/YqjD/DUF883 family membrane-anchored ribosome-binding protein
MEDEDLKEIRGNIDQTKRDLASTLGDLRDRYSADRMKQSAKETADDLGEMASEMFEKRKDDLRRVADRIGETIRNHPVPFAAAGAAGIGVSAWALLKHKIGEQEGMYSEGYGSLDEERPVAGYYAEDFGESGFEFACEPDEEAGEARGKAGQIVRQMGERARNFGETARSRSEELRTNFVEVVREHPFLTGTATFLLGILSGLIFPSTRPEDQVLGSARARVRQKAQELKEEAKESAQRVVEETKRAAEEEAQRHGLTPS